MQLLHNEFNFFQMKFNLSNFKIDFFYSSKLFALWWQGIVAQNRYKLFPNQIQSFKLQINSLYSIRNTYLIKVGIKLLQIKFNH